MRTLEERSEDGLFGYGRGGLPGEFDLWLDQDGAVEDLAREIIARWLEWAETHYLRGRRRLADSQLPELATLASILVRYHAKHGKAPSFTVAFAIDHVLGLIIPKSGNPRPDRSVLRRVGLPVVEKVREFLDAARLDGEADAKGEVISERGLAKSLGVSRDTVGRWRNWPEYKRRREAVAALSTVSPSMYRRRRS